MANIKITELDAATTLASTDVVPVVDVSADETKKITANDLFRTLPDGTAAAPALAFADDNNTGILSPAENQLAFATGGTQRVTIDGSGNVTISGDLTVSGATTTVESTTVTIDDKNIELGSVASPSNTTADGGGITLKASSDKTIKWINSTGYWTFNTGIEVGGHLQIDDDNEIRIGTAADLVIRHNGTDTILENDTGHVYLSNYANDKDIILRSDDGSGGIANYVVCDGSAGDVRLYKNGSQKLQTAAGGINVTGEVECDSLDVDGVADITGNVTLHGNLDLQDNDLLRIGSGDDLQIFHGGTNSIIDNNTGDLYIQTTGSGDDIILQSNDDIYLQPQGSENGIQILGNAAVRLAHNNVFKLDTTSTGIDVTGEVQCDSLDVDGTVDITGNVQLHANLLLRDDDILKLGNSDDLQVKHDGTDSFITNLTGDLHIRGNGDDLYLRAADDVFIQTMNGETAAKFIGDGAVELNYDDIKKFATKSDGVDITGELQCDSLDVDGTADITGTVTLHGNLDLQDNDKILLGTGDDLEVYHDANDSFVLNNTGVLVIRNTANDQDIVLQSDSGSGGNATYVRCDGSNGEVQLNHYGSTKLATKSGGIDVTGEVQCDSLDVDGAGDITGVLTLHNDLDMQDSDAVKMGTGDDYRLFHNGSNSFVENYTGGLYIDQHTNDNDIQLRTDNGSGSITTYVLCDGSTGSTKLFHYGSEKLATQTYGIDVQGEVQCDALDVDGGIIDIDTANDSPLDMNVTDSGPNYVSLRRAGTRVAYYGFGGSGNNFEITNETSDGQVVFFTNSTSRARIDSSGRFLLGTTTEGHVDADDLTVSSSGHAGITIRSGTTSHGAVYFSDGTSGNAEYRGYIDYDQDEDYIRLGSAAVERFRITSTGAWAIEGGSNYGTSGQVLTSNGNDSPTWQDAGAVNVGGASAISMNDNVKINFGNSSDLQIYHDGSNSRIDNGHGSLIIKNQSDDQDIILTTDNGSGSTTTYLKCDGSTGDVILYQYGNQKLQTFSSGVDITGELQCDSLDVDGAASFTRSGSGTQDVADFFNGTSNGNTRVKVRTYANGGGDPFIFFDAGGTNFVVGEQWNGTTNNILRLGAGDNMGTVAGMNITASGHCLPDSNNARDLGSSSSRWRNVYTNDLNLSNEGSANDVDGTWGNYTIQEGEDDLFLINRRNGKKYKFNLTEVS